MSEKIVGKVEYFFEMSNSAMIKLQDTLMVGDEIHVKGSGSNFKQKIKKMENKLGDISIGKKDDQISIKFIQPVTEGDYIYKIKEVF